MILMILLCLVTTLALWLPADNYFGTAFTALPSQSQAHESILTSSQAQSMVIKSRICVSSQRSTTIYTPGKRF